MLLSSTQPLVTTDSVPLLLALDPAVVAANEQDVLLRYRYRDITAIEHIVRPDDADVIIVRPLHPSEIRACEQAAGYKYESGERVRADSIRAANARLTNWGEEQHHLITEMAELHAKISAAEAAGGKVPDLHRQFAELNALRDLRTPLQVFEGLRHEYLDDVPPKKLAMLQLHEGWRQRRAEAICKTAMLSVWSSGAEVFTADSRGFPLAVYEPTVDASVARTQLDLLRHLDEIQADIEHALAQEPKDGELVARLLGKQATAARALQVLEQVTGAAAIHEIAHHVEALSRLPKAQLTCFASLSAWAAGATPDRAASAARRA